jgi:hypothetical protein
MNIDHLFAAAGRAPCTQHNSGDLGNNYTSTGLSTLTIFAILNNAERLDQQIAERELLSDGDGV